MPADINNFLLSLAAAIAEIASLEMADTPRSIWVHQAVEDASTAVYSVIRAYGGPARNEFGRLPDGVSVQVMTHGRDSAAVLGRAWAIEGALLDEQGRARFDWQIPAAAMVAGELVVAGEEEERVAGAWLVHNINAMGVPGIVGRDGDGRYQASFNFDVRFEAIEAEEEE
jgi:hypothetical protein